ncbi:MAG: recombinase family protein [Leptolyngbyaceae bacterium]|nr:recombinase family protein [Leptolyngbyaceae bacterium]
MKIVAYLYTDPLIEPSTDASIWGWEIDQVYQDLGRQNTTAKGDRPHLQQLLKDCQTQPVSYLLVRRIEELGDSVEIVSTRLAELEAFGVRVIVTEAAGTPTPLQVLQELEQNQRSRRIRQGHARNRVKALPPPGKAPYGYKRGKDRYVLDRSTAPIVKDFFEQFLLYGSLRGAVRYLEKRYSKKISASTGHRWLTNRVYRGDLEYQDGRVVLNTHIPIIAREEAAQVDRLLRRNRPLQPRTASAPRSLAGLAICGECQSPMTITQVTKPRSSQEYLYLRPTACPKRPKCSAIAYDQVLEKTITAICQELPRAVSQTNLPPIEGIKRGLEGAIAGKQQVLDQIPTLLEQGIFDAETATLRTYNLQTELAQLQDKLAQLPPVNLVAIAQTVSIPQFWLDLSESERRFYFREFLRQVQLIRHETDWRVQLVFIF